MPVIRFDTANKDHYDVDGSFEVWNARGTVKEINSSLDGDPMIINRDPYGDGWMIKVEVTDVAQVKALLDASTYKRLLEEA